MWVVGEVDQEVSAAEFEAVQTAGILARIGLKALQRGTDRLVPDTELPGEADRRQGVREVVSCRTRQGDRNVLDAAEGSAGGRLAGSSAQLTERVVLERQQRAAGVELALAKLRIDLQTEPGDRDVAVRDVETPRSLDDLAIVRVEHQMTRRPCHDELGLDQGGEILDPPLSEVIFGDVENRRHVGDGHREAAPQHPAARRLQQGEVDSPVAQDGAGAARAGPIPQIDGLVADLEPIGGADARHAAARRDHRRQQPDGRRLARWCR